MFYGLQLGKTEIKESFNYQFFADEIEKNTHIGLDIETFFYDGKTRYKGDENPVKFAKQKAHKIDWSKLTPKTGNIQYIQVYIPSIRCCVALSMRELGYNYLSDNPLLVSILKYIQNPNKKVYIHNALYEGIWFLEKFGIEFVNPYCTMLASQLANAGLHYALNAKFPGVNSLGQVVKLHLGLEISKAEQTSNWSSVLTREQKLYMLLDPFYSYCLGVKFEKQFINNPAMESEQGSVPCFTQMNTYGMPCDINLMKRLELDYSIVIDELLARMYAYADEIFGRFPYLKFSVMPKSLRPNNGKKETKQILRDRENFKINFNSSDQMLAFINFVLKLEGKEEISDTQASTLESLGRDFLFGQILGDYRTVCKVHKYIDKFIENYDPDKKAVIGNFRILAIQGVGRSSCSSPSLQIVPQNNPILKRYGLKSPRVAFKLVDDSDEIIIDLDFSASHSAIATALSNDPALIESVLVGVKIHYYTLSAIFSLKGKAIKPAELQTLHSGLKNAYKTDTTQKYLDNLTQYERDLVTECDEIYTLSKNAYYSFLNLASKYSLQNTFMKEGILLSLDECQLLLDACKKAYPVLYSYLLRIAKRAESTIKKEYVKPNFDLSVYNLLSVYGIQQTEDKWYFIDNVTTCITPDGRYLRQSCMKKPVSDDYWLDESGEKYYTFISTNRPSRDVSNQWLSTEATIAKRYMEAILQYGRLNPHLGIKLRVFAHDELIITCKKEFANEVKDLMNETAEREFKKFSPYYEQEPCAVIPDWTYK